MLESTSKFRVVEIVCRNDDEGFAIAKGYWDGDETRYRLAARWFEEGGMGYPQTFGRPQWFLLPARCTARFDGLVPGSRTITLTLMESGGTPESKSTAAKMAEV